MLMKNSIAKLGILLFSILLLFSVGSLFLFFHNEANTIYGLGLGIILVGVVFVFISYLIYDLYSSLHDDFKHQEDADNTVMHYRNL